MMKRPCLYVCIYIVESTLVSNVHFGFSLMSKTTKLYNWVCVTYSIYIYILELDTTLDVRGLESIKSTILLLRDPLCGFTLGRAMSPVIGNSQRREFKYFLVISSGKRKFLSLQGKFYLYLSKIPMHLGPIRLSYYQKATDIELLLCDYMCTREISPVMMPSIEKYSNSSEIYCCCIYCKSDQWVELMKNKLFCCCWDSIQFTSLYRNNSIKIQIIWNDKGHKLSSASIEFVSSVIFMGEPRNKRTMSLLTYLTRTQW